MKPPIPLTPPHAFLISLVHLSQEESEEEKDSEEQRQEEEYQETLLHLGM